MEVDENTGMAEKMKPTALATAPTGELDFNVDFLRIYYDKAFHYDLMFKWLSYMKVKDTASSASDNLMLQSLKEDDVKSE